MLQHRFVETALVSLAASIAAAVALVPTGLFLFATGTSLLWQNEARTPFDELGRRSVVAPAERAGGLDGAFVSVTAPLTASAPVGDPVFFEPGEFAYVARAVEMYAWQEHVSTETRRRWGGAREVDTVTEYALGWTAEPYPPGWMRYPDGHENPELPFRSANFVPAALTLGAWTLDMATTVPLTGVPIGPSDVRWTEAGQRLSHRDDGWFYRDGADPQAPELGDLRVRFVIVRANTTHTALGVAQGASLGAYSWLDGVAATPLFAGDRKDAIRTLGAIETIVLWGGRLGCTVAILVGLTLLAGPLFAVFDIVPPLGVIARLGAALVIVPLGLLWAFVVGGASQLFHSVGFLLVLAVVLSGVAMSWWDSRRAAHGSAPDPRRSSPRPSA